MITNLENGLRYIGKTTQKCKTRFGQHFSEAKRRGKTDRTHFQNSMLKHGRKGFIIEPIFCVLVPDYINARMILQHT